MAKPIPKRLFKAFGVEARIASITGSRPTGSAAVGALAVGAAAVEPFVCSVSFDGDSVLNSVK